MNPERRALYNSLRYNWLLDPTIAVDAWQVEDYREMSLPTLFDKLRKKDFNWDKQEFIRLAENFDNPEDLTIEVIKTKNFSRAEQDYLYLIIFELWRRLVPEKPSLTIFCDELDYQIHLHDTGLQENSEALQNIVANLEVILEENIDHGADPIDVFVKISEGCANDIESFLYDYIAEQIDEKNYNYASELIDSFCDYATEPRWFDFLRTRLLAVKDPIMANRLLYQLTEEAGEDPDLEFNLEMLSFMVHDGDRELFVELAHKTLPLIKVEEDFRDFLNICADFYRCIDAEQEEKMITKILQNRVKIDPWSTLQQTDPGVAETKKVIT